jgi:hypothetical protein
MTIDKVRDARESEPFVPFTISLGDGRQFYVRHPDAIWITPEATRTIFVSEGGEDYSIIDLLLVTSVDFKKRGPRGRSNGNGKHR